MTAPRWTMILMAAAWGGSAQAIGLGPLALDSALGQPLQAKIPVYGAVPTDLAASCIRARVESLEGVPIASPRVTVSTSGNRAVLALTSTETVNEPVVSVRMHLECGMRVQRNYEVLLDFPSSTFAEAVVPSVGSVSVRPLAFERATPRDRSDNAPNRPVRPGVAPAGATVKRNITALAQNQAEPKITKAILKLSTDEYMFTGEMKLSETLSLPSVLGHDAPLTDEQTRIARSQFAAILRGENPAIAAALEAEAASRKLRAVEIEKVTLVRENEAAKAAYDELSGRSYSAHWVAVLSGLLIFSFGTVAWLTYRLRKAPSKQVEWWKTHNVLLDDDPTPPGTAPAGPLGGAASGNGGLRSIHPFSAGSGQREPVFGPVEQAANASEKPSIPNSGLPPLQTTPRLTPAAPDTAGTFHGGADRHLNVEEVSDIVQEAEFWMLLNDHERALQLLEPHADVEKPDTPVTWLYLIDLYRQVGNREKYQSLGQRFKKHFNARIPRWDEDPGSTEHTSLEDFPSLLERITNLWSDKSAAVPFLESLLIDDRDGERIGFDLPVYKDIILLIGVANESTRLQVV